MLYFTASLSTLQPSEFLWNRFWLAIRDADYFLDLWTSLEILLDFFRISSDRRDVSLENHENAKWLLGKSGPACRRDARKHKVSCSRWSSKRAPQGHPKSNKILDFVQSWCKVDAAFAGGPLGSILDPFWHPRGSKITKTSYFTLLFDYYFQALWIRGLHKHTVFYNLFTDCWAPAVV